jgi:8-oxo-dGTP diphosphatase
MKLAVDLVVRRNGEVLFIKRKYPPFEGMLALPGGFVEEDEAVEIAAIRELEEETNVVLSTQWLRLVGVFSAPRRDPRERVVSVAFACDVSALATARAGDDAAEALWLPVDKAIEMGLAFDHAQILGRLHDTPVDLNHGSGFQYSAG